MAEAAFAHVATMAKAHFWRKRSLADVMQSLRDAPRDGSPGAELASEALAAMARCAQPPAALSVTVCHR